jgi:hypothetical protein
MLLAITARQPRLSWHGIESRSGNDTDSPACIVLGEFLQESSQAVDQIDAFPIRSKPETPADTGRPQRILRASTGAMTEIPIRSLTQKYALILQTTNKICRILPRTKNSSFLGQLCRGREQCRQHINSSA